MNKHSIFKRSIVIGMLSHMMLYNVGCSLIGIPVSIGHYLNKSHTGSELLVESVSFASADYIWYNQAQKYQDQGESKSKAYAKGGLVALGVFVVVLYVTLFGHAIYHEKIKKKY